MLQDRGIALVHSNRKQVREGARKNSNHGKEHGLATGLHDSDGIEQGGETARKSHLWT